MDKENKRNAIDLASKNAFILLLYLYRIRKLLGRLFPQILLGITLPELGILDTFEDVESNRCTIEVSLMVKGFIWSWFLYMHEGWSPLNFYIEDKFHRATRCGARGVKSITNYAASQYDELKAKFFKERAAFEATYESTLHIIFFY
ncbi:hypothetical protein LOK49_LG09G02519 [Camellia lanceoleosa]|uniref:Uncharacterized protein n=1 Tax=Camellia lanceoleosa TaxID=1840588 RepID=A0ACC0GI40_9ERIC|nr:hypothetical protein LOK49_LG09G02519 [Camellia lanceoleosa]